MANDQNREEKASKLTELVEGMFDSFGIKVRVEAVNFEEDGIVLEISIAMGVRIEDVEALSKTLALVVASPTGKVEIVAPISGKSLIGIKIPNSSV